MPPEKVIIEIITSDKSLIEDLKSEGIDGLQVGQRMKFNDCAEFIPEAEPVITAIIKSSSTVGLTLLSKWLYDRFIKKQPDKTSINGTNITDNCGDISVVINNTIQIIENRERDQKD